MFRLLLTWLCLYPLLVLTGAPEYQEPKEVATTEGLPSNLVNHSVCVISGEYTDSVQDVILPGPETLIIQRFYGSNSKGHLGTSWSFNHYEKLVLGDAIYDKKQPVWIIALRQPSGGQLDYLYPISKDSFKRKRVQFNLNIPKGLTNGATNLSGRTNIKNQKVYYYPHDEKIVSISGAGDRRSFFKIGRTEEGWPLCGQQNEEKVNGSVYKYEGKGKNWDTRILCQSKKTGKRYSYVNFSQLSENHPLVLETSDGRSLKYYFIRHKYKEKKGSWENNETKHATSFYLSKVEHPYAPIETYEYAEKALSKELQMVCKRRPDGRFVKTEYYHMGTNRVGGGVGYIDIKDDDDYRLDRVKKQIAPVGQNEEAITTHRFVYHCKIKKHKQEGYKELLEGTTDVYDAHQHRTKYTYDEEHRLTSVMRYTGVSPYVPYRSECFLWGQKEPQKGNLLGKIFKDAEENVHHVRYFTYDDRGNVLTSALCGKLTGLPTPNLILNSSPYPEENGYECEYKTYTYSDDGLNLILSTTDSSGKVISYQYLPGTDHIQAKYVLYNGLVYLREFYFYDDHYVLTQKILDDGTALSPEDLTGVTERHVTDITPHQNTPLGLPQSLDEGYIDLTTGQKKLLHSFNFHYSPEGKLLKQEVFDTHRQLAYTLRWEYDKHGNVIREQNALGEEITKEYDANDNLTIQQGPSSEFYIKNTYDFANRLICQEEIHEDGKHFSNTHTYDYLGNCIATVNPYGHETMQTFDEFGRVIAIQYPAILDEEGHVTQPIVTKTYDIADYPICVTHARGGKTQTEYNIRGQPTCVIHPDGTTEHWVYQLDGQLAQYIAKNGTKTVYTRDFLGRVTDETLYAANGLLLKKTQHIYNAFHLIQSINAEGEITYYSYDAAGRLEWTQFTNRQQQNLYDSLGRLAEVREWFGDQPHDYRATMKIYDLLDRIVEERMQSADGTILHRSCYAYDVKGNRTLVQNGDEKLETKYDAHNNPITITNGLGHITRVVYDTQFVNSLGQRVLQTIITDPLGYQTMHTYDSANRLVETMRKNPFGMKVACQQLFYDLCGNKCRVIEEVIQEGEVKHNIENVYRYSENNQITLLIEAAGTPKQKLTHTHYNPYGQKEATIKPDGMSIHFDYDAMGRLKELKSADGSVHYLYEYNLHDQVTRIKDLRWNQVTERAYDKAGQLIGEMLGNRLQMSYTYDKTGRVHTVLLPDQTGIEYVYDAVDLKEIHRVKAKKRIYSHVNQNHTLAGRLTQAHLPGNNGNVEYAYNPLGHCTKIQAPQFQQVVPSDGFDMAGNLIKCQSQGISYRFAYDDYYQIKSEAGHVDHMYQFDSLANRIAKDGEEHVHNALNQLIQKGQEQLFYDTNGNLIRRQYGTKIIHYTYDALDRLISVTKEGKSVHYFYDAFNRRLMKKREGEEDELFVYQGQEEIGRWVQGAFQEVRLLGKNKRNPMVALEVKGIVYVPVHDILGNVVCLLDLQGKVVERYRYTVFGESEILSSNNEKREASRVGNPWQFASKRIDEETGLVAFGLRYYDVQLGRWITPDPAGFADGSNLYAYVHNSPLLYWDQFGLYKSFGLTGLCGDRLIDFAYQVFSKGYYGWSLFNQWFQGEEGELEVKHVGIEDKLEAKYNFRQDRQTGAFERTGIFSLNEGYTNPQTGQPFQLSERKDKLIVFMNGIRNSRADFDNSLIHLGMMSKCNVKGVYSPSFGWCIDGLCYLNAIKYHFAYEGVRELHKLWHDFCKDCPADATLLMVCHSRGAAYVKNALLAFPIELRKHIEVIAIAPGGYIDPTLCKSVKHFESNADIVPLFDMLGRERCNNTIFTLERHPQANPFFDHDFTSKTYLRPLDRAIKKYEAK